MTFSQVPICKAVAVSLAFICTILLALEVSHPTLLPFSQALGVVHLNRVAPACKPRAEETKATIHTVFKERPDLANPSRKDHSDPGPATGKPTWGGLWVQRNETYKQGWGISMFHALHCLEMIRDGLADKSSLRTHGMLGKSAGNAEPDHHKGDHVRHCFAYIAQVRYSPFGGLGLKELSTPLYFRRRQINWHSFSSKKLLPVNQIEFFFLIVTPC